MRQVLREQPPYGLVEHKEPEPMRIDLDRTDAKNSWQPYSPPHNGLQSTLRCSRPISIAVRSHDGGGLIQETPNELGDAFCAYVCPASRPRFDKADIWPSYQIRRIGQGSRVPGTWSPKWRKRKKESTSSGTPATLVPVVRFDGHRQFVLHCKT